VKARTRVGCHPSDSLRESAESDTSLPTHGHSDPTARTMSCVEQSEAASGLLKPDPSRRCGCSKEEPPPTGQYPPTGERRGAVPADRAASATEQYPPTEKEPPHARADDGKAEPWLACCCTRRLGCFARRRRLPARDDWSTTSSSSTTRWRSPRPRASSEVDIVPTTLPRGGPLAAVRSLTDQLIELPVVALTASPSADDVIAYADAGWWRGSRATRDAR